MLQQQAQILAAQSSLYPLQTQADEQRDRLAVLTGQLPAQFFAPTPDLAALVIPAQTPVALPSAYLANRPDLRAARALVAASLFAYRNAVLNAFGEAADGLQALQNDKATLARAQQAAGTASQAYQLARQQFALGAVDYTTVLTAQIAAGQQTLNLLQTRTALLLDIALLQSAMAQ